MKKSPRRILIVDDQYENRYMLQSLLEGNGFVTITAANGLDALKIVKTEPVDAIISDILMPVMDGFKLCRTVKEDPHLAHIPFIFNTASYTETRDRHFGLSIGADEYITKPIDPGDLLSIIREVLSRSGLRPADQQVPEHRDQLSFYTSYSYIVENKLNIKVAELDRQREAFQLSEKKYQQFLQNLQGIGYLLESGTEQPLVFEGQVAEITGYPADEFRKGSLHWPDMIHPHDRDRYLQDREKIRSEPGATISMEYRILHADGSVRWVHEIASHLTLEEPETPLIQGAIYDNTRQKEADEKIRRSEVHYRVLFETMAEGVIYRDGLGRIVDYNPAAGRITGISRDELASGAPGDADHPYLNEDSEPIAEEDLPHMVALRTGRESTRLMGIYNRQDSRYHWIMSHASPLYHEGEDQPYQVLSTFEDITREEEARHCLRQEEKKYCNLVENISDALFSLTPEGMVTYVSPAVRAMTGYDPSFFTGSHFFTFVHPDEQEKAGSWFTALLAGDSSPIELRAVIGENVFRQIRVRASVLEENGTVVLISGIATDVTTWKEAEALREEHTREMESLLSLHQMSDEGEEEILEFALTAALRISGSATGFMTFFPHDNRGQISLMIPPGSMQGYLDHLPAEDQGDGYQGLPASRLISGIPVIVNGEDPGSPGGARVFSRLMEIPVRDGNSVVGMIAVANRQDEYTRTHADDLITLGNALWEIISRKRADQEIQKAIAQISENMEQMATLNDTIRNPLSVIAAISEMVSPAYSQDLIEAVHAINAMVTLLDKGWVHSEKVRNFLIKHYRFSEQDFTSDPPAG